MFRRACEKSFQGFGKVRVIAVYLQETSGQNLKGRIAYELLIVFTIHLDPFRPALSFSRIPILGD